MHEFSYDKYADKSQVDLLADINRIATRLQNLGESFANTGNQMMYDTLADEAWRLNAIAHAIREISEREMSVSLDNTRKITGGLLKATLTGCIGKPTRELDKNDQEMIDNIEKTPTTMEEFIGQTMSASDSQSLAALAAIVKPQTRTPSNAQPH